jgi:hypothetical protein
MLSKLEGNFLSPTMVRRAEPEGRIFNRVLALLDRDYAKGIIESFYIQSFHFLPNEKKAWISRFFVR